MLPRCTQLERSSRYYLTIALPHTFHEGLQYFQKETADEEETFTITASGQRYIIGGFLMTVLN